MATFLFATHPITGHVQPALPIVSELVRRGHTVRWYTGAKFRQRIEAVGAQLVPYSQAYDYDDADYDAAFPGRAKLAGLNQIRFDFLNLFIKATEPMFRDLSAIVAADPVDVVVNDPAVFAAYALAERGGPPNALYNITCLGLKGREVAPFGLGLMPSGSPIGLLRNRFLQWLAPNVVFGGVSAELGRQCDAIGVKRRKFDGIMASPFLTLALGVPSMEYPRSDLPASVHFIGALLPDSPAAFDQPSWWPMVEQKKRPIVLVTQGTVATNASELVAPTVQALADEPVTVIVAGASPDRIGSLPANAVAASFIPFKPLMPFVDVFVTNGGFGGVQFALSNGVPIVAAGTTEDKPEIGNQISRSGVGINLKTNTPTSDAIRAAVQRILSEPAFRERARAAQAELATHTAPVEAADLLERLADTKEPILRHTNGRARSG